MLGFSFVSPQANGRLQEIVLPPIPICHRFANMPAKSDLRYASRFWLGMASRQTPIDLAMRLLTIISIVLYNTQFLNSLW
jgi:hypothetical protein